MELVFYEDAAAVLDVSVDTLKQAISRGELTRAGIRGNRRLLIKEQVMLFTGMNPRTGHKRRISYNALSEQEQALWRRYADEITHTPGTPPAPVIVDEETIAQIVRQELLKQEREDAERKASEAREKEERFRKDYPFLYKREPMPLTA